MLSPDPPPTNDRLRRALYDGEIFLLDPTPASSRYAEIARSLLHREFPESPDLRQAHEAVSPQEFFLRVGAVRRELYLDEAHHALIYELAESLGFNPRHIAFDPVRLRAVSHDGHLNPAAKAVYYGHRDTWYGHPSCLITWWIPLHELSPEETFLFYPDRFDKPVPNDSETFDYDDWVSKGWSLKIGWQDPEAGKKAHYPGVTGPVDPGPEVGFACQPGQNLLFSGAHYHKTREQSLGTTRFSLDFRLVHLGDHAAGLGAPDVDNRSRGSALSDYVHP